MPHEIPSSDEVADLIRQFSALTEDRFAEALADCVMDPIHEEVQAFRSPELVARSLAAARYNIDHVNTVMSTREGPAASNTRLRRATLAFRNKMGRERRILESIVAEAELRKGIIRNAPNPRARAMKRLWQLNLMGDVPAGTAAQLLEEEIEKAAEAKRAARRAQKDAARAAKRGLSHV